MPLEVRPFTDGELYESLRSPMQTRAEVETHDQARYLFRYLSHLGARAIVVEDEYTDADYLDDFANYYVKSFEEYERRCRRLHFFRADLNADGLLAVLLSPEPASTLQDDYLGFVVARPLPEAIIGRTVLVTYPADDGRRHYPATRQYKAHLFGTPLTVESLAFQEQDTVLAACATVALWSAFHKTSTLFGTASPTPAEITRAATATVYSSRPLPSKGLVLHQMARAVREVGLEPEVFECGASLPLLSLLVGYLDLGIPVILGLNIEGVGKHAVAVTGYSLRDTVQHKHENIIAGVAPRQIGLRVDELYVHDDRHGPFAKISAKARMPAELGESAVVFDGTWTNPKTGKPAVLTPIFVLVPVYHKIRLGFIEVQKWITKLAWITNKVLVNPTDAEWATVLATTNDVKRDIKLAELTKDRIEQILFTPQPRFVWRATMTVAGQTLVEILFDATGMERSRPVFDVIFYDDQFRANFAQVLSVSQWAANIDAPFLDFLRKKAA